MQLPPAKRNPPAHRIAAMTLTELIIVIAIIAVLVSLLLPRASHEQRGFAQRIKCVCNLKQIGLSFRMWENDNHGKFFMQAFVTDTNGGGMTKLVGGGNVFPHFQVISNELNDPRILVCPSDTERMAATNFTTDFNDAHISYFVSVDPGDIYPGAILTGDRNLEIDGKPLPHGMNVVNSNSLAGWTSKIHNEKGNIGLADGSVQRVNSEQLRQLLQNSGLATNRLVLP